MAETAVKTKTTAKVLVSTAGMSREEWFQWRKRGIGGSDAAAILGLDPYRSAFDVYCEKLGLRPEPEDNEAMRQGRDLEDYVAARFTEKTGKAVRRRNAVLQHPEHGWMIANVDRFVVGEDAGLECKTTSVLNKARFHRGEYPPHYYVQCMHYMAVTGARKWYLAVLVLHRDFHVFEVERDEDEIESLIEAERRFWEEHVVPQIPPAPDGSDSAAKAIKAMFPEAKQGETVALFGMEDTLRRIRELDSQIEDLEREREALKQKVQAEMGTAEFGRAQGYLVSWRNKTRQNLDTARLRQEKPDVYNAYLKPPQVIREFRIKEVE